MIGSWLFLKGFPTQSWNSFCFWTFQTNYMFYFKAFRDSFEKTVVEFVFLKVGDSSLHATFSEINSIINIFLEKLWRQKGDCYLFCCKAFVQLPRDDYIGVLFEKVGGITQQLFQKWTLFWTLFINNQGFFRNSSCRNIEFKNKRPEKRNR